MNYLLSSFPRVIVTTFKGRNLFWNILAIVLTYCIVASGFDWYYLTHTRNVTLLTVFRPAVFLGAILPIFLPLGLVLIGHVVSNRRILLGGWALGQAALAGWFVSSAYKAFTGRIQPNIHNLTTNISTDFNFGFWNHGIFWGWPSSHTTVAFAMVFALIRLYPRKLALRAISVLYAFYIGIGVSFSIHWFSDFVAGAIIGTVIGLTVGYNFRHIIQKNS